MVSDIRTQEDRNEQTSFCIIDSQSVKNTDTAENKGYDAAKKISGIKRHVAVDTNGLPHAIHITTANVTDRDGALAMIVEQKQNLKCVKNLLADAGYSGEWFSSKVKNTIKATVEIVIPKRWVVERSFAWLEKCRRLSKNCERKIETSLQMVVLAFLAVLMKRL